MNKKHYIHYPTHVFLYIQLFFYTFYMFLDIMSRHRLLISDIFKYFGILLCFIFTYYLYHKKQTSLKFFVCSVVVLFADYFLLFGGVYTIYGILLFCVIQGFYFTHIKSFHQLGIYIILTVMFSFSFTYTLFLCFHILHPYVFLGIQYILMLSINIVLSIIAYKHEKTQKNLIFLIGMLFYFMCDINVGLINLPYIESLKNISWIQSIQNSPLQTIANLSMWLYYLPAQILIVLSQKIPKSK